MNEKRKARHIEFLIDKIDMAEIRWDSTYEFFYDYVHGFQIPEPSQSKLCRLRDNGTILVEADGKVWLSPPAASGDALARTPGREEEE